jgi:hypothetical protein
MYRITMVLDLFKGPHEQPLSHATLQVMLDALMYADMLYLIRHPEAPRIYESGVRYEEEPVGQEDWQDVPTCLRLGIGDCLPLSTLVAREDYSTVALGLLRPGDRILGDGEITTVLEGVMTGEKPILAFHLENGCTLRCSPDHRLFLSDGEEKRASEISVGMRLKTPSSPFPVAEVPWSHDKLGSEDFAWLVGTYIADGWHDLNGSRFAISGDDETPKRGKVEQKNRVIAMMEAAGVNTRRHKKYVDVQNRDLTAVMQACGGLATTKRVPNMKLTRSQVEAMIEGLQTDASIATSGTVTHGTVSPELALQLRLLYRMLGQSVHIRRWDEHGGLGKNPIYRVTERRPATEETNPTWKSRYENLSLGTKVRGITEEEPELCGDITTDTGKFYLPESDVVVHNCEDLACWRSAELRVRDKIEAKPTFIWKIRPSGGYLYHIQVKYPDGRIEDPSRRLGMR